MIDVDLPAGPPASALVRSFAACLASVTKTPLGDLPLPDADLPTALGIWRSWLAEHDAGLVPIADPNRFQWAGWWIATVRHDQASETGPGEIARSGSGAGLALVSDCLPLHERPADERLGLLRITTGGSGRVECHGSRRMNRRVIESVGRPGLPGSHLTTSSRSGRRAAASTRSVTAV